MEAARKKTIRKGLIILGWLFVWQLLTLAVGNAILLAGPIETLSALLKDAARLNFWQAIACSTLRILGGFLLSFGCAFLLGALAERFLLVGEILEPVISLLKSVPVASVVILLLIWTSSEGLSTAVCFMVVLPQIYYAVRSGIRSTDGKLLEMARVFRLPWQKRIWYLYRPAVLPYLCAACRTALGMSWKSGIAAEVIGVPAHTIGERLYMAKIYLETGDLFAWTLVILFLSFLSERIFLWLLELLRKAS